MQYTSTYLSPLGKMLLSCDDAGLTGLWFEGQKYYARCLGSEHEEREEPVLKDAKRWLDIYFSGRDPGFTPPLHMIGTPFQISVWNLLQKIPYGTTTPRKSLQKEGLPGCPRRPWAVRDHTTPSPLSSPVTELSALPAV